MNTDKLIESLVERHRPVDVGWIERWSFFMVGIGGIVAICLIGVTIGFRGDLMAALESGRIVAKYTFMLTALVIAGHLFVQMARPGRLLADQAVVYTLPLGFILFAIIIQLALMGPPTRSIMLGDHANWLACMTIVPILAIVPFIGLVLILRRCAPTDLRGAGVAAGVFATTIGAIIYAAHCPCDMPTFVGVWYPIAFAFGGAVGGLLGPRLARW